MSRTTLLQRAAAADADAERFDAAGNFGLAMLRRRDASTLRQWADREGLA